MEGLIPSKTLNLKGKSVIGNIRLAGSKSISNRVLLIQALCNEKFQISNVSNSADSQAMAEVLTSTAHEINVGHAGTAYRFGTAFLACKEGEQLLKGSERMHERPIGPLVEALNTMGADIEYIEKEGFPPLKIGTPEWKDNKVFIDAGISSQYISAILMIAPSLPEGVELHLEGHLVSKPYIQMTLDLMQYYGVKHTWKGNLIKIEPQKYISKDIVIEGDWSSASYWYGHVVLAEAADITIGGLVEDSLQGDSKIAEIMEKFGVKTTFLENSKLRITKEQNIIPSIIELDFSNTPDLVQTVSVICAALGTTLLFTGAETLKIKEADRIAALKAELLKFDVHLVQVPSKFSKKTDKIFYLQEGKAKWKEAITIETYHDHRMALAFSLMSHIGDVNILNPDVIIKSYPEYWGEVEAKIEFT